MPIYRVFWLLIQLRYKLIWAQSRSSGGKIGLFLGLYVIGMTLLAFLTLSGIGTAAASMQLGRAEETTRWMLTGLFTGSIILGAVMGVGPRGAFSDVVLRRYPLTPVVSFFARHFTALLDPIWPMLLTSTLGLGVGFTLYGSGSISIRASAAIMFTITAYFCAMILLAVVDHMLQSALGTTILGVAFAGAPMVIGYLLSSPNLPAKLHTVEKLLRLTPPGISASLLVYPDFPVYISSIAILIGWCLVLAIALVVLEHSAAVTRSVAPASSSGRNIYDLLVSPFSAVYAPLMGKALRYHLRSNRVRAGLVLGGIGMMLVANLNAKGSSFEERIFVPLAYLFIVGIAATGAITLNQFGYDGAGIRRYATLPVPFIMVLRAGSIVSLILGGIVTLLTLVLWTQSSPVPITPFLVSMFLCAGIAGLFFFNALSLFTSIQSPKSADFQSVMVDSQSTITKLVWVVGMIASFVISGVVVKYVDLRAMGKGWWVLPLLTILCIQFYIISFRFTVKLMNVCYESILETIAGSKCN
ncbi:MAG: hypothetical protein AB7U82_26160 [Blastocatellales bacterium]